MQSAHRPAFDRRAGVDRGRTQGRPVRRFAAFLTHETASADTYQVAYQGIYPVYATSSDPLSCNINTFAPIFARNSPRPNGFFIPLEGARRACDLSPARHNVCMARKSENACRRPIQAATATKQTVPVLTAEDWADLVDAINEDEAPAAAADCDDYDPETIARRLR